MTVRLTTWQILTER